MEGLGIYFGIMMIITGSSHHLAWLLSICSQWSSKTEKEEKEKEEAEELNKAPS